MKAIGDAPGKIILLGEHFVVKGIPAIAFSINLRANAEVKVLNSGRHNGKPKVYTDLYGRVEKCLSRGKIHPYCTVLKLIGLAKGVMARIRSRIPPCAGLGSSSATSLALAGAACYARMGRIDKELVLKAALEADKYFHGKPSGIDTITSLVGGFILFRGINDYEKLNSGSTELRFIVVDTGLPKKTSKAVMKVLSLYNRRKRIMSKVYEAARELIDEAVHAIKRRDYASLGELMLVNQGLLNTIGVSFPEAESIIATAVNSGALGAKITGAGLGGSVIILAEEEKINRVVEAVRSRFSIKSYYVVKTDPRGLTVKARD